MNATQSGAMGEGWSDWYAIDFTDDNGWFFDTPASGDAFPFRYSAGDDVVFPHAAVDCPVGAARELPGPGSSTSGRLHYADYGKS